MLRGLGKEPQTHEGAAFFEDAVGIEAHYEAVEMRGRGKELLQDLLWTAVESLAVGGNFHGEVGFAQFPDSLSGLNNSSVGEGYTRLVGRNKRRIAVVKER